MESIKLIFFRFSKYEFGNSDLHQNDSDLPTKIRIVTLFLGTSVRTGFEYTVCAVGSAVSVQTVLYIHSTHLHFSALSFVFVHTTHLFFRLQCFEFSVHQGCGSAFIFCGSGSNSFSECGSGSNSFSESGSGSRR